MEIWQRWVFIKLEDSACLMWVVTAHGVCLLQLVDGPILGVLVSGLWFEQSAVRNSKGELGFRTLARFQTCYKWLQNGAEFKNLRPSSGVGSPSAVELRPGERTPTSDRRSSAWGAEGTDVLKWETAA